MELTGQVWDAVEVIQGVHRLEKDLLDRNEGRKPLTPFRRSISGSRSELDSLKVRVLALSLSLASSKRGKMLKRYVFSRLKSVSNPGQDLYRKNRVWRLICTIRNRILATTFQKIIGNPEALNKEKRIKKPTVLTSLKDYEKIQHLGEALNSALKVSTRIGLGSIEKRSAGIRVFRTLHFVLETSEKAGKMWGFRSLKTRYGADSLKSVLESILRVHLSDILPTFQSIISTKSLTSVLSKIHLSHQSKAFFKIRVFNLSYKKPKSRTRTFSFNDWTFSNPPVKQGLLTSMFRNINHSRVRSGIANEHASLALIRVLSGVRYRFLETSLMRLRYNAPKGNTGKTFIGTIMKVAATVQLYNIRTAYDRWTRNNAETHYERFLKQTRLNSAGKTLIQTAEKSIKSTFLSVWQEQTNRVIRSKRRTSAAYFLFTHLKRILLNRKTDFFSILPNASLRPDLMKKSVKAIFTLLKQRIFSQFMLGFYPIKSWAMRKSQVDSAFRNLDKFMKIKKIRIVQRVFEEMKTANLDGFGDSPEIRSVLHISLPNVLARLMRRRAKTAFSNILIKAKTVQKSFIPVIYLSTDRHSHAQAKAHFQHKISIVFDYAKMRGNEVIQRFFSRWKTAGNRNPKRIALVQEFYSFLSFKFLNAFKRTRFLVWNKIRKADFRHFRRGTKKTAFEEKSRLDSIEKQKGTIEVRNYSFPSYQKFIDILKRIQTGIKKSEFANLKIVFFKEKRAKATYSLLNHLLDEKKRYVIARLQQHSRTANYLQTLFSRLSALAKKSEFARKTTLKMDGLLHWWETVQFLSEIKSQKMEKAGKRLISILGKLRNQRKSEGLLAISKAGPLAISKRLAALKIVSMNRYKDKLRLRESVL